MDVSCNTENFEECIDNQCICVDDINTCSEADFIAGTSRCSGETVQDCIKHGKCYRWEDQMDCSINKQICADV